jgi:hypothetical protein
MGPDPMTGVHIRRVDLDIKTNIENHTMPDGEHNQLQTEISGLKMKSTLLTPLFRFLKFRNVIK